MRRVGTKLIGFQDGYYTILNKKEYEFRYGDFIIALSEINFFSIKDMILSCPYFHESFYQQWECFAQLCDWLNNKLEELLNPVISDIVFSDMGNFISDVFIAKGDVKVYSEEEDCIPTLSIKQEIFLNTEYDGFGVETIGQLLLTALCNIVSCVVLSRGVLKTIVERDKSTIRDSISPVLWEDTYVLCQFTSLFGEIQPVYTIDALDTMLLLELSKICEKEVKISKCQNCGKYFIPESRTDEIYCNRPSPQNPQMTCKKYGSKRLWYDKIKSDEAAKLARNVYMAKQMLVKRNPDLLGYKKMFEYFKIERKKWEELVRSGARSKDEYISWLNEMKAKKTL